MPRKIRDLLRDYKKAGFYVVSGAGKGDHRKLKHDQYKLTRPIILDGKTGSDCKPYQEKDLKAALRKVQK